MAHRVVPEEAVAQAAATLAAGALSASDAQEIRETDKLGDYAMELYWHIYGAMRVGVETADVVDAVELEAGVP